MADYGVSDTSTTALGTNQFPISAVYVPNDALRTLEGGPVSTDSGGKKSSPASIYVKDGGDITQGAQADAAWSGSGAGSVIALLKKLVAELASTLTISGAVQDIEQASYVAASSPPSTTNAGSDTPYTFTSQVNRVIIQNNTSVTINYAFDATASAGSLVLVPGAMLIYPKKCTVLHLYTAAAQPINGTAAANVVVLGAN